MVKVFDSRDPAYRSPYGAVTQNTEVSITFCPFRTWNLSKVSLMVWYDLRGEMVEIPMKWHAARGEQDVYKATISTTDTLGPLWYHFEMHRKDDTLLYYGNNHRVRGGVGDIYQSDPAGYQLTVYLPEYTVPDWYGNGVTYQIFPDRFHRLSVPDPKGRVGDRIVHQNWDEFPVFGPNEHGEVMNNDFYGGSIAGVHSKLEYLYDLGVTTIYFNPIFEAASNHRYDTADYMKVDPMFGTMEEFTALCKEAKEKYGIRVILDGVFNHTGFDSRYFNGRGTYPELGAHQSKESKYVNWYEFTEWPNAYSSWWGVYTLPQVNESHPDYIDFIVSNQNSVVRSWIRAGASGWRLDVADELPDFFIEKLRDAIREENEEAILIGEVWEDATSKVAYGARRHYLLGRGLDSVMNYPFRNALISFLRGEDAREFVENMECLRENYPRLAFFSLMNHIGTHDSHRALTALGCDDSDYQLPKHERAHKRLSPAQRFLALARIKLASAIQFSFPGSPLVYYGDEAGMEGFEDPFNRLGYPWGRVNKSLLEWYRRLGNARRNSEALRSGDIRWLYAKEGLLVYERTSEHERVVIAVNASIEPIEWTLPWQQAMATDLMSGRSIRAEKGALALSLEPMTALFLL